MTDFIRDKIIFAITLLATLFTLNPILTVIGSWGFPILGFDLQVIYVYYVTAAFLAIAVYMYAFEFLTERFRASKAAQVIGDVCYGIALVAPPLYVSIYVVIQVALLIGNALQIQLLSNILAAGLSVVLTLIGVRVVGRIRVTLRKKETSSQVETLRKAGFTDLSRAAEVFRGGFYDLTLFESYKAIEQGIRKVIAYFDMKPDANVLDTARRLELFPKSIAEKVDALRRERNKVAHDNVKVTKERAGEALQVTDEALTAIERWIETQTKGNSSNESID